MPPSKASQKSSSGHLSSAAACLILLVVFMITLSFLMHHEITSGSVSQQNPLIRGPNSAHVQSLIDQTNALLNEVLAANLSLNSAALKDIDGIRTEKKLIQKDMHQIKLDLKKEEDNFVRCIFEKYQANTQREQCEIELAKIDLNRKASWQMNSSMPVIEKQVVSANPDKWLVIGMPSIARMQNEDYLAKTIESLTQQLPVDKSDLLYGKILVVIVNVQHYANKQPEDHAVYQQLKKRYGPGSLDPRAIYFEFVELKAAEVLQDPIPNKNPNNDKGTPNKPGYIVRKQTRSLVSVLRKAVDKGKYYLFLEDDMEFCPNVLVAIQYLIGKASRYHGDWLAIRASYGMNGVFMHNKDLNVFAQYLETHQARRPPDHLVVEWYAGERPESKAYKGKRANIGFKHNLFNHIGLSSTLRTSKTSVDAFPHCYDLLVEPTVFQVEAYSPKACPHDDIWPCNVANPETATILWKHNAHKQAPRHRGHR